jgi:hypothetical protein
VLDKNDSLAAEIQRRIAFSREAASKLMVIWKDTAITRCTKKNLLWMLVFPIFMYGAEM